MFSLHLEGFSRGCSAGMKDGCSRVPGSIWGGRAAGWRKGVISRGKNHRLLLLLPWVSLVLELASVKEVPQSHTF